MSCGDKEVFNGTLTMSVHIIIPIRYSDVFIYISMQHLVFLTYIFMGSLAKTHEFPTKLQQCEFTQLTDHVQILSTSMLYLVHRKYLN